MARSSAGPGAPDSAASRPAVRGGASVVAGLTLGSLTLGLYLAAPHHEVGDSVPARYLPLSLLREADYDLDEFGFLHHGPPRGELPYFLQRAAGHVVSRYSPGPPLLAVPVYALPVALGLPATSPLLPSLEKTAASLVVALSVLFVWAAACRMTSEGEAWILALVYALGTSSFSLSSRSLLEHGPSQLCIAATLWLLARAQPRLVALAGLSLGATVLMRPTGAVMAVPLVVHVLRRHPRQRAGFALWALPPLAALALYQWTYAGAAGSGRSHLLGYLGRLDPATGLLGLLLSPSRGLFVYSPVLAFSVAGAILAWRHRTPLLCHSSLSALALAGAYATFGGWWGGHVFGPRYLADALPILCLLLCPVLPLLRGRRALALSFAALATLSMAIHTVGAFLYDGRWDALQDVGRNREVLWSWRDGQLSYYAGHAVDRARALAGGLEIAGLPTSLQPAGLSGRLEPPALPGRIATRQRLDLTVHAANTGTAVWLAPALGERGSVRLTWQWLRAGQVVVAGWESVHRHVRPGEPYAFRVRVQAPDRPGEYELRLDLSSRDVASIASLGVGRLQVRGRLARRRGGGASEP